VGVIVVVGGIWELSRVGILVAWAWLGLHFFAK
jgi:hypothetical protein